MSPRTCGTPWRLPCCWSSCSSARRGSLVLTKCRGGDVSQILDHLPAFWVVTLITAGIIAFNLDYIGGANGFIGIPLETTFDVVYVILALVVFIAWRFDRSRLGYAARACRDNVHAAAVMGINTAWVKTVVFALGGSIAGVGGVRRAYY